MENSKFENELNICRQKLLDYAKKNDALQHEVAELKSLRGRFALRGENGLIAVSKIWLRSYAKRWRDRIKR